jgi:hypothetical protein
MKLLPKNRILKHFGVISVVTFALSACGGGGSSGDAFEHGSSTTESNSAPSASSALFTTFQSADVVIGQADFSGSSMNQGGLAEANTIKRPQGNPGVANGALYLPDRLNRRLLGFNTLPTVNNTHANFVLGQPDSNTTTWGTSATKFGST